jgi:3-mercaptopyruvate sulfurtransferase SseA
MLESLRFMQVKLYDGSMPEYASYNRLPLSVGKKL